MMHSWLFPSRPTHRLPVFGWPIWQDMGAVVLSCERARLVLCLLDEAHQRVGLLFKRAHGAGVGHVAFRFFVAARLRIAAFVPHLVECALEARNFSTCCLHIEECAQE